MKPRIEIFGIEGPPDFDVDWTTTLEGTAVCTLDDELMEPLLVHRQPDGSIRLVPLDRLCIDGVPVLEPRPDEERGIRLYDSRLTPELRALLLVTVEALFPRCDSGEPVSQRDEGQR